MTGAPAHLKLQPRLFMLAHSGRHLQAQLQAACDQRRSFCEYLSPQPVAWNLLQHRAAPLRQTQVESLQALELPEQAGINARLSGEVFESASPDTLYVLPDLSFELLDPQGVVLQQKVISCGSFRTFASGQSARQLLEYLATTLNYELAEWGWSCTRQGKQLVLEAHPLLAGWNLTLSALSYGESSQARCSGGLEAGLSSTGRGQRSGRLASLHWGPWLINGQSCRVSVPFGNDSEEFLAAFAESLNQQLGGITAVWTPERRLLLMSQQPGQPIEIRALPPSALEPPDLPLRLELPEGTFGSGPSAEPLGIFVLNGVKIRLEQTETADAAWLCDSINLYASSSGVRAALSPDDRLHLQALQAGQMLSVEQVPDLLQRALGLTPLRLGESDEQGLEAALERWTLLLNQVMADLPPDLPQTQALFAAVAAVPPGGVFGPPLRFDAVPDHALEALLAYLQSVSPAIEQCLQAPETQAVQNLRPLQLELEMTPPPPPNLPGQDEESENRDLPTFDHKI